MEIINEIRRWYQHLSKMDGSTDLGGMGPRSYHTFDHALKVATTAKALALPYVDRTGLTNTLDTIFWAGMMHDLVYEPGNPDNEKLSAEIGWQILRDHAIDIGLNKHYFFDSILATKVDYSTEKMTSHPFVATADLMDFSSSYSLVKNNYYAIRGEFNCSDKEYYDGTKKILNILLSRGIYPDTFHYLEARAMDNIFRLLEEFKQ